MMNLIIDIASFLFEMALECIGIYALFFGDWKKGLAFLAVGQLVGIGVRVRTICGKVK